MCCASKDGINFNAGVYDSIKHMDAMQCPGCQKDGGYNEIDAKD